MKYCFYLPVILSSVHYGLKTLSSAHLTNHKTQQELMKLAGIFISMSIVTLFLFVPPEEISFLSSERLSNLLTYLFKFHLMLSFLILKLLLSFGLLLLWVKQINNPTYLNSSSNEKLNGTTMPCFMKCFHCIHSSG